MNVLSRAKIYEGLPMSNFEGIWGSACKDGYSCEKNCLQDPTLV